MTGNFMLYNIDIPFLIAQCDLGVEKLNKLNLWFPSWKMAAITVKTQNSAW